MKIWAVITTIILTASNVSGAISDNILGAWKTDGGDSQVELFRCRDKICGKVIWLKVPNYIDRNDGPVGVKKTDRNNPVPALRNRPIVGMLVMKGFTANGSNRWERGICYDPHTGKSYRCKMKLASPGRLELRGYIGIALIGRTFGMSR